MSVIEFRSWGKIPRLNRPCTITEKLDGTNSAVGIVAYPEYNNYTPENVIARLSGFEPAADNPQSEGADFYTDRLVYAQSRKRLITPGKGTDNHGFAQYVLDNANAFVTALGIGLHFGEWFGSGIERGYGLKNGEKFFSLFNTPRYSQFDLSGVPNLSTVPVLYEGMFSSHTVEHQVEILRRTGSRAAPGYDKPEGIIVFHEAAQVPFKVTIENDSQPKGSKEI